MDQQTLIYDLLETGRLASALELAVQAVAPVLGGNETSAPETQTVPAHGGPVYTGSLEKEQS